MYHNCNFTAVDRNTVVLYQECTVQFRGIQNITDEQVKTFGFGFKSNDGMMKKKKKRYLQSDYVKINAECTDSNLPI